MATAMALHLSAVVRAKPRSAPRRWLVELHENTVVGTTLKRLEWSPGLTAVIPRDILRSIILAAHRRLHNYSEEYFTTGAKLIRCATKKSKQL